jgi:hypothetical protein
MSVYKALGMSADATALTTGRKASWNANSETKDTCLQDS